MGDVDSTFKPQPINGQPSGLSTSKKKPVKKIILITMLTVIFSLVGAAIGGNVWYNKQLSPLGDDINQLKLITIEVGSNPDQIGELLESESIIRSSFAFNMYTRLQGNQNMLQAGTYRLSSAESTEQIVEHLVNGSVDEFSITFYPGATIKDINISASGKKYDVTTVLLNAGFTNQEIATALAADYDSPLFAGKPVSADLEGYIYGQTYNLMTGATAVDALNRAFTEFYDVIEENDFINKFAKHGLNLYEGITLASIIQREANNPDDQKQVAQVFYSRLELGMELGSDVTYQYIADKLGIERDPKLDSPYNTRKYPNLPPGPIAVPGLSALQAVADPAAGDYIFFLSGDDDVTYFARTLAEHESNIINHCAVKCSTP